MARLKFNEESYPGATIEHYLCFDEITRDVWVEVNLNEVPHVRPEEKDIENIPISLVSTRLLKIALYKLKEIPKDISGKVKRHANMPKSKSRH